MKRRLAGVLAAMLMLVLGATSVYAAGSPTASDLLQKAAGMYAAGSPEGEDGLEARLTMLKNRISGEKLLRTSSGNPVTFDVEVVTTDVLAEAIAEAEARGAGADVIAIAEFKKPSNLSDATFATGVFVTITVEVVDSNSNVYILHKYGEGEDEWEAIKPTVTDDHKLTFVMFSFSPVAVVKYADGVTIDTAWGGSGGSGSSGGNGSSGGGSSGGNTSGDSQTQTGTQDQNSSQTGSQDQNGSQTNDQNSAQNNPQTNDQNSAQNQANSQSQNNPQNQTNNQSQSNNNNQNSNQTNDNNQSNSQVNNQNNPVNVNQNVTVNYPSQDQYENGYSKGFWAGYFASSKSKSSSTGTTTKNVKSPKTGAALPVFPFALMSAAGVGVCGKKARKSK